MATWDSIIGIPQPSFGLGEPSPWPSPWISEQAGFYYVNPSGGSDSRTYGYPSAPRATLPTSPAAGSVIAVAGTHSTPVTRTYSGTAAQPIWIKSYSDSSRAAFTGSTWTIAGTYTNLVNVDLSSTVRDNVFALDGSYNAARGCTFSNTYGSAGGSLVSPGGTYGLFDGCTFGPSGNWQYTSSDIDRHGIKCVGGTYTWIVRSTFYQIQGDGIQVGDSNYSGGDHIYIGRNTAYNNLQTGFWVKRATDVIMSQNTCYGMTISTEWSAACGLGGQYENSYVWVLYNTIYDSVGGVVFQSDNGGGGSRYIIGNVIYGTTGAPGFDPTNSHHAHAITDRSGVAGTRILNNTIWNCHAGISAPYNGHTYKHNIIGLPTNASAKHLFIYGTGTADYNYYGSTARITYDGSSRTLAQFQAIGQDTHGAQGVTTAAFVDAANNNYRLAQGGAPVDVGGTAVDTAYSTFLSRYGLSIQVDRDAGARPVNTNWDIGAYEYGAGAASPPTGKITLSVR